MPPRDVGAIKRLARRQDGIVTCEQVLALGFERDEVRYRVRTHWLEPVFKGVYVLGALTDRGRIRAATLATGPHSAASFTSATALSNLIPTLPAVLHVSLTQGQRRNRNGLIVHRGLEPEDVTHIAGIPVTTTLRTLEDLNWPDRIVREALARGLVRPEDVPSGGETNEFEERFRELTRRAGLPQPRAQYRLGPYRLDFAWPELKVAVETDGWGTHGRRRGFEDDRAKDARLMATGWRVLRVTYRRLRREPAAVLAELAAVLALARAA